MVFTNLFRSFFSFAFTKGEDSIDEITEEDYKKIFIDGRSKDQIEATYQRAWASFNTEVEHYWKRANYFWAFQIASFAGYFTVLGSKAYGDNPQVLYFVICIGLVTSFAWALTNLGSKSWHRHWEIQVNLLEDSITGPLNKIITSQNIYSVTKINEIVSRFIITIWCILVIKYFKDHLSLCNLTWENIDYQVWLSSLTVLYFITSMIKGHGRSRYNKRSIKLYFRNHN